MPIEDMLAHWAPGRPPASPYGPVTPGIGGQANQFLGQAGGAGLFNPTGSPAIMAAVRRNALRASGARRQRGATLSSLFGLDPQQAAVQAFQNENQAAGEGADAINSAQLQQLLGGQDWYRNLFMNRLGADDQMRLMRLQQKMARDQQHGQFLGGLGSALGGIAGSFLLPGVGTALGSSLGGGLFGGGGGGADYSNIPAGGAWGPGGYYGRG